MRATNRPAAMPATVIDMLEGEWELLRASPELAAALRRWGSEDEVLRRFRSVDDLVAFVHARWRPAPEREEVLASLACRSGADELAAQVLLHVLLPGCKAIVAAVRWHSGSPGERAAEVVADLWGRIRALPPSPRPQWVAAPLLGRVRKRLVRRARAAAHRELTEVCCNGGDTGGASLAGGLWPSAADELAEILSDAAGEGVLSRPQAELIWDYRLCEVPAVAAARRAGASPDALERRRLRAEHKLREAYVACA